MDPTKCMVCQGSLGLHPMKVKVENRIGRICNRVNKQHADWLLDRKMDTAYLRITYRRRGGLLGIIVLMLAFISLLWVFSYTTDFKGPIVAAATFVSIVIGAFLVIEYRTITVGDRMRRMLTEAELERPIRSQKPIAALESMDELARHREEEPPMPDPFATDLAPAPTRASPQRATMMAEDGIPGIPQPVVAAKEWEVMAGEERTSPAPAGTPGPAAQPAPGTPAPPTPAMPLIEDLPDDTAPSQAPPPVAPATQAPPVAPPLAPAAPTAPVTPPPIAPATTMAPPPPSTAPPPPPPQTVQAPPPPPPAVAQPAMVEELPAQVDQRPPPSTALSPPAPAQAPPPQPPAAPVAPTTPAPPVPQQYQPPPAQPVQPQQPPAYQQPPAQQPPAQQPPVQQPPAQQPPVQQPPAQQPTPAPPPQPAQQVAPEQPQQPQQPQRPKKTPQEEADEWVVDWE